MEHVVDYSTACGLQEAKPHPEDHPPRAPELSEGAAGMVLTPLVNVIVGMARTHKSKTDLL